MTVDMEGPNRPQQGRLIPWPEAPSYPILADLRLLSPSLPAQNAGHPKGLLAVGQPFFTAAGKTALAWSFKLAGLAPGTRVLMPAYHCLAMVEPLEWLGLRPVFYRLHEDLSVDFQDLEARVDVSVKAVVAVHYFGFPQDGHRLRAFCDAFGLSLIEDCAHGFFGSHGGKSLGSFGDFAIGSLPKFFPLRGGGCVVSGSKRLPWNSLAEPGRVADLQALVRELQIAHYYGRLRPLRPLTTAAAALAKALALLPFGKSFDRLSSSPSSIGFAANRIARRTLRSSAPDWIISQRRRNYEAICGLLADAPGIALLKPHLEPGVVPYMVPLRIPALRRVFAALEDRAVPMQRFGQFLSPAVDRAPCPVSADLSHHGLQLPCHQSLRSDEIHWMVDQLRAVSRAAAL